MKTIRNVFFCLTLCLSQVVMADYTANTTTTSSGTTADAQEQTAKYLKMLGDYLGYDLTTDQEIVPIETMLDYTLTIASTGQQMLNAFFSAIPVNAYYKSFTSNSDYDAFNSFSNILFTDYASASTSGTGVAVTENFDQPTYQQDPVSQSVLNILGTPDYSNPCVTSSSDTCLDQNAVMNTVLKSVENKDGKVPSESLYYTYDSNSGIISQLNANTLLAPLMYSTDSSSSTTTSTNGLPAANQEQQAQAFVRYISEAVLPITFMSNADYATLYSTANNNSDANHALAVNALYKYLTSLRVYAAKSSVVMSNLYDMMGRRMPQKSSSSGTSSKDTTSQALNEFKMATWRIYDPSNKDQQWVQQINASSPATIQKEIAVLLSEINYQMYLTRQQQERQLLTNTMMLMQMISLSKPDNQLPSELQQ